MNFRTTLIKLVTFIGGLYFFLKFVLPEKMPLPGGVTLELGAYREQITTGLIAIGGMSLGLGLINLVMGHGAKIIFRRKGWIHSLALLVGLFGMLTLSGLEWSASLSRAEEAKPWFVLREFAERIITDSEEKKEGVPAYEVRLKAFNDTVEKESAKIESMPEKEAFNELLPKLRAIDISKDAESLSTAGKISAEIGAKLSEVLSARYTQSTAKRIYTLFFQGIFVSLGSAMFSLLGFYIASAAYRAFRVKSVESGLMMFAALLVILGQIPFMIFGSSPLGEELYHLFPRIRLWLLSVPNTAAFRAIEIGAAIGALIMGFRMWLSIESSSFSKGEKR